MSLNRKKILIADDDPVTRLYLKKTLEKWDFEVITAENGLNAWAILRITSDIKVAILDWQMPGFNGLELIQKMRQERQDYYIYSILLTSKDSHQDMLEGMTAGADDHIRKPFDPRELFLRLRAAERILDQQAALIEMRNQEVQLAARIQKNLLFGKISHPHEWFSADVLIEPGKMVSGDFYNFYQPAPHLLDVLLGDVMGKGISASIVGAGALNAVNSFLANNSYHPVPSPALIINHLNREISPQLISFENFIALTYARFDMNAGAMTFVDCGHMPIYNFSPVQTDIQSFKAGTMPLGFSIHEEYDEHTTPISVDDRFVLFSDGVTDIENRNGVEYGVSRLKNILEDSVSFSTQELTEHLKEDINLFCQNSTYEDDLSFIIIRINHINK